MADPQRSHEPTMEEILASIRRIISDDGEAGDTAAGERTPEDPADASPEGDEVASQDDIDALMADAAAEEALEAADQPQEGHAYGDDSGILELTDEMATPDDGEAGDNLDTLLEDFDGADEADGEAGDELVADDIAFQDRIDEEPAGEPESIGAEREPPVGALLSADAQSAASAAFGALASTMLSHSGGARTLEQIVEDLLRPLLKAWLDDNLPPLVERLVRQEIERVARQAR